MDFGKISDFHEVDFTLPDTHQQTSVVLGGSKSTRLKVYLGTPVWANANFKGKIYPEKTPQNEYLNNYQEHFQSIELNTTHYQTPSLERVKNWTSKVSSDFKFCPKFPQTISHAQGDFSQLTHEIEDFLNSLEYFKDNLGISFIQFSDYFDHNNFKYIKNFIKRFPSHIPLAIELRNKCWFQDSPISNMMFALLHKHNISTVLSDVSGRRDVLHMRLTTNKAFIRFTGNSLHLTDFQRLDEWMERIEIWRDQGLDELYFFLHQPDESQCIELAEHIAPILQKLTKFPIKSPKRLKTQEQLDLL